MANIEKSKVDKLFQWHEEIIEFAEQAFDRAMKSGELLIEIKKSLGHGRWTSWAYKELPYGERTAQRYMNIYKFRKRLKTDRVSDLPSAYKLIENLNEFEKVAKDYELSSQTKANIKRKISPTMENVEQYVSLSMPPKERKQRAEKIADREQGSYIANRVIEIRRELKGLTSKLNRLKMCLRDANMEQIVGIEVRGLLRSMRVFNTTYESLRPFLDGSDDNEPKSKQIDSIEARFPRKELPAKIT